MSTAWESAYGDKGEDARSWTEAVPVESLRMIEEAGISPGRSVIDVGGGASYLADRLVQRGFTDVTLLELSAAAIEESQRRNGARVTYVHADVTTWRPGRTHDLWHDRAVLHFLVEDRDAAAYRATLLAATAPGSSVIIAVFAPDGPDRCSGFPVRRWSAPELGAFLGEEFDLTSHTMVTHTTPWGSAQNFVYVHAVRR